MNQHARLADSQYVAQSVILGLIHFSFSQCHPLTKPSDGFAHFSNHGGFTGNSLLRTRDFDHRRRFDTQC